MNEWSADMQARVDIILCLCVCDDSTAYGAAIECKGLSSSPSSSRSSALMRPAQSTPLERRAESTQIHWCDQGTHLFDSASATSKDSSVKGGPPNGSPRASRTVMWLFTSTRTYVHTDCYCLFKMGSTTCSLNSLESSISPLPSTACAHKVHWKLQLHQSVWHISNMLGHYYVHWQIRTPLSTLLRVARVLATYVYRITLKEGHLLMGTV